MDPIDATQPGKVNRLQEARARRDARADAPEAVERPGDESRAERSRSEDVRAVKRAARSDDAPQARARAASGEGDRELVSISDEARQLLRRARASERQEEAVREAEATQPDAASSGFSSQLIAVRVGPTPIEDLPRPAAESRAADALAERAFLRQLERVLSLPERPTAEQDAEESDAQGAELRLLGERDDESAGLPGATGPPGARERPALQRPELEVARSTLGGVERSPSSARLIGSEPARAARREQEDREREFAPSLRDADLVRATSLAPQSGAARAPRGEGERGAESSGPVDSRGAPALEATPQLSQSAVLEAESSAAIVTRFLGNLDAPEPGPPPRVRQFIDQ